MGRGTFRFIPMLRTLRYAALALAALVVAGLGTLVILARMYEDEVKTRLIGALNTHLNAPVSVGHMDLTLLARFPQASMRLNDVFAREVRTDGVAPDTLLFAEELFLEFSIWDLYRGNYTVDKIHASQARIYPGLDRNGKGNYLVWKSDTAATGGSPISLDRISFDGLVLRYRNDGAALEVLAQSNTLSLGGRFSNALNTLALNGDVHLIHWTQGADRLLADRKAHMRLDMEFGGPDALFQITHGEVVSGTAPLEVTLAVASKAGGEHIDLRANGLGLDLADAAALLPDHLSRGLRPYQLKGEVDLAVKYEGPLDAPSLSVGAKVVRGALKERHSGASFTDIFGELSLELSPKGTPRKLVVRNFSARSASGAIRGGWQSNGLTNATIKADLRADIDLAELLRFVQVDTLEEVGGRLVADLHVQGRLRDVADVRPRDLHALSISGTLASRDATLKLKGVRHTVRHLDADLALHGNDATVQGLKAELQGSPVVLSGTLRNLMPYLLFDDQRLVIEARGGSSRIDLAALISTEGSSAGAEAYTLTLPQAIELDLDARVDELVFEDFKATGISAAVRMKDRMLAVSPMEFGTASGRVRGTLELDARDNSRPYPLAINADLNDIELRQLFQEFKDFGQDFIGQEHISGRARARVAFNAPLSTHMELDMERLVCVMDIGVDNGSIKAHPPLIEVADHLQKNKLVAPFVDVPEFRRRLSDIRFAHLENQIEIRQGAVHIPQMLVSSSVMDIELSGTHWFDDRIDHHLNFRLSDLFRKGKSADEFGPVVDDGSGMRIYLHMYGTAGDPQFGNDGAMAAARRSKQFQEEKQVLKKILREELGSLTGKASSAKRDAAWTDQAPPLFKIEEAGADSGTTAGAQGSKTRTRRGAGRLLKEDREEEEVVFEVK